MLSSWQGEAPAGHQIKAMVILPSIQAVYDFGQLLKVVAKGKKTALATPFKIGTFFSSHAEKRTGDKVRHWLSYP